MYCKHCGSQIDDDCIICPKCGKQVGEIKTEEKQIIINNTTPTKKKKHYSLLIDIIMLILLFPIWIIWMLVRPKYEY